MNSTIILISGITTKNIVHTVQLQISYTHTGWSWQSLQHNHLIKHSRAAAPPWVSYYEGTIEHSKGIECFGYSECIWSALIWSDHRSGKTELFGVSKVTNPVGASLCRERDIPFHCGVALTTRPFNPVKSETHTHIRIMIQSHCHHSWPLNPS